MLNTAGNVAECTGDNIFIAKHGKLLTPPLHAGILEGITRNIVIELARGLGLEVVETDTDQGLILVRGAVPGAKNSYVLVYDAVKGTLPEDAPFPAGLVDDGAGASDEAPAEAADDAAPEGAEGDAPEAAEPEASDDAGADDGAADGPADAGDGDDGQKET